MAVTLPTIKITFQQLASTFIQRSARGIAILILRDATQGTGEQFFQFGDATQVDETEFTPANRQYIKDALSFGPLRVSVVKLGEEGTLAQALALAAQREKTGWITVAEGTKQDWSDLASWIKAREKEDKSWKAVLYQASAPDCMHLVSLDNETVTFADDRGEAPGDRYTPSLAGLLAACNVERGATNRTCANLVRVAEPEDPNAAVGEGKFLLINDDDEVKVGVDVNTLTTTDGSRRTEDMKYIETVEAMDLIRDDITAAYRRDYMGSYRNGLSNQMLFVAAANEYFRQLEDENVLDREYDNGADLNVSAQRAAWIGAGRAEAAEWDDATVRANSFKRTLFLSGQVKILGSMGPMEFLIQLA